MGLPGGHARPAPHAPCVTVARHILQHPRQPLRQLDHDAGLTIFNDHSVSIMHF